MTTEHYNLQAARSVATSEATSRSNLFISTVSTTLVALALIGQISELGTAFFVFALLLFPSLFFFREGKGCVGSSEVKYEQERKESEKHKEQSHETTQNVCKRDATLVSTDRT